MLQTKHTAGQALDGTDTVAVAVAVAVAAIGGLMVFALEFDLQHRRIIFTILHLLILLNKHKS